MRKYAITRRSAVTVCNVKSVNVNTYEVVDMNCTLEGAFADATEALKAVNKAWENDEFKPIAVTGMSCKVKTYAMTAQQWFDNAEVISETEISADEAAKFGKRSKSSDSVDAQ